MQITTLSYATKYNDNNTIFSENGEKSIETIKKSNNESQATDITSASDKEKIDSTLEQIKSKLKTGEQLSSKDIRFLRENSPEYYKKAISIADEKKDFGDSLSQAETKTDVSKINSKALNSIKSQNSDIVSSELPQNEKEKKLEENQFKLSAYKDEYLSFINSKQYKSLPENEFDTSLKAFA